MAFSVHSPGSLILNRIKAGKLEMLSVWGFGLSTYLGGIRDSRFLEKSYVMAALAFPLSYEGR